MHISIHAGKKDEETKTDNMDVDGGDGEKDAEEAKAPAKRTPAKRVAAAKKSAGKKEDEAEEKEEDKVCGCVFILCVFSVRFSTYHVFMYVCTYICARYAHIYI